jgi:hypothetical protein
VSSVYDKSTALEQDGTSELSICNAAGCSRAAELKQMKGTGSMQLPLLVHQRKRPDKRARVIE